MKKKKLRFFSYVRKAWGGGLKALMDIDVSAKNVKFFWGDRSP